MFVALDGFASGANPEEASASKPDHSAKYVVGLRETAAGRKQPWLPRALCRFPESLPHMFLVQLAGAVERAAWCIRAIKLRTLQPIN